MSPTFGILLRQLRRRSGMTQSDLAERLGYSRSMIAALETDRRLPDVDAVVDAFVPALGLHDARDLARQLVEQAANARRNSFPRNTIQIADQRTTAPRQPVVEGEHRVPHRVPTPPMPLLGRDRDVQTLCDRFLYHDCRLLSLVGPPGVGKTRLALAIATRLQIYLPDGACFVPLAAVANVDHVAAAILEALGVRQQGRTGSEGLISHLRRKEMLLVLDNFEQILDAAPVVAQLLSECPTVRVLVTSRERLHLRAERIVHVQPLAVEDAVELFLDRIQAVDAGLALIGVDLPVAQSICRRLDCLPLAIELCAAQADFFSLEEILERLVAHSLDTLVDGATDLPARHRTLRATIRSSYELLDTGERGLLQALSVFAGGCTPAMIEDAWCGDSGDVTGETSKVLRSLVAKSLVQVETTAWGDRRLLLLESVREFARERLEDEGDLEAVRARHFDAVSRYLRHAEAQMWRAKGELWVKRILQEQENLFAALHWASKRAQWSAIGSLLCSLKLAFERSLRYQEFLDWFERLLPHTDCLDIDLAMVIKVEFCYSANDDRLREEQGRILKEYRNLIDQCKNPLIKSYALLYGVDLGVDFPDRMEALRQAVQYARAIQTTEEFVFIYGHGYSRENILPLALYMNGCQLFNRGEAVESEAFLRESLQASHESHSFSMNCWNLGYLARIALSRGNLVEAVALAESAVEEAIAAGHIKATMTWRGFLGNMLLHSGNLVEARRTLEQAWDECSSYGDPFTMQIPAIFLADLALQANNLVDARHWLVESMCLSAKSSRDLDWRHIHRSMLAARLAVREGRDERAAQLYGFMRAYDDRIKIGPTGPVRDTAAPTMAEVRARLGDEAYWDAYNRGREMPVKETLASLLDDPA